MGFRGVFCSIASIMLVFALMAVIIGSKRPAEEVKIASLINSLEKNEDMAELLWVHCRLELMHANEVVADLEFNVQQDKTSNRNEDIWSSRLLTEIDTKKILSTMRPEVEHTLLDCLRKKNLMFLVSGEERASKNWYMRYLDYLYARPVAFGRRELLQTFGEAPAPSPTIVAPAPASSSPETLNSHNPTNPPLPPFFPADFGNSNLQPTSGEPDSSGSNSSSDVQPEKQKSNGRTVLIAVVVTASATFVVSALLFLCYRRVCGAGSGLGRNDERPLLSLSLSDYSVASSHKTFPLSSSINKEKPLDQTFDTNSNDNKMAGDFYLDSHMLGDSKIEIPIGTVTGAGVMAADNSAPGRLGPHGLPPLKPPPGRANSSIPTPGAAKGALVPSPQQPSHPPPHPPPPTAPSPPPPPLKPSGGPRPPVPGPPPPPKLPSASKTGPRPPPPPGGGVPPPRPPPIGLRPPRPSPFGSNNPSTSSGAEEDDVDAPKTKLKPFFWDKVLANPDHSMVWHQIKSGSFQFNEEMIETLFGYAAADKNKNQHKQSSYQDASNQYIQIIDPKKSQNLSILLKALNVTTEEVCDALQEGNELPSELIRTLLKMAPTTDEELKLRLYSGELSRLGPAERFLKVLVNIPFAFKRLESLLFMCTLQEEETTVKESFVTLAAACTELRESRLFLKLLEAVLKTGNRMNDGTFRGGAQAFKLDTLLKLADVKGIDGKTTLLHFVVQEIIRSEGVRAARAMKESRSMSSIKSDDLLEDSMLDTDEHYRSIGLQVVSGLSNELEDVKRAAVLDADSLTGTVSKLGHALIKSRDFLNSEMKNVDEENGFRQTLKSFVQNAEVDIMWLLEEEKRIMDLVKSTADYFHGNSAKDEGLRLFVIVRDFLIILDKVCKEVKNAPRNPTRPQKKEDDAVAPSEPRQSPSPDPRQRLFPAIKDRRTDYSSSDDDGP